MTTEKAFDRMCEMLPHVANIINDERVSSVQVKIKQKEDHSGILNDLYPLMLVNHRSDLYAILAIVAGKSTAEIANMPFSETKKLLEEPFWNDFFAFFPLFLRMAASA